MMKVFVLKSTIQLLMLIGWIQFLPNDFRVCWLKEIYHKAVRPAGVKPSLTASLMRNNCLNNVPLHQQLVWLPECRLQDLSRGAFFGVVVISVEKVSKDGLVGRDVCRLATVYPLSAGFRQGQTRPPIRTSLIIFNAPRVRFRIRYFGFDLFFCCQFFFKILWPLGASSLCPSSILV